jgi:hypothetical protein
MAGGREHGLPQDYLGEYVAKIEAIEDPNRERAAKECAAHSRKTQSEWDQQKTSRTRSAVPLPTSRTPVSAFAKRLRSARSDGFDD